MTRSRCSRKSDRPPVVAGPPDADLIAGAEAMGQTAPTLEPRVTQRSAERDRRAFRIFAPSKRVGGDGAAAFRFGLGVTEPTVDTPPEHGSSSAQTREGERTIVSLNAHDGSMMSHLMCSSSSTTARTPRAAAVESATRVARRRAAAVASMFIMLSCG
jgi:hypothetical protein